MDKASLLAELHATRCVYILGVAATALLATPAARAHLNASTANFGRYGIELKQVLPWLEDPQNGGAVLLEFIKLQMRSVVKEGFEQIKAYASHSGQLPTFHGAPWYQFSRLIRNQLSHEGRFSFSRYDHKLLPVTWRHVTIDASCEGKPLAFDFFSPEDGLALVFEMGQFVEARFV